MEIAYNNPASRGQVSLQSKDPTVPPLLHGNYLREPVDINALMWGLQEARRIASYSPLREVLGEELIPGPNVTSQEDIISFIRCGPHKQRGQTCDKSFVQDTVPRHHVAGTCRMGSDNMAVVDNFLKVHQVQRLRIADASIMPQLPSGNTHATCLMIGERAAKFVLADASTY